MMPRNVLQTPKSAMSANVTAEGVAMKATKNPMKMQTQSIIDSNIKLGSKEKPTARVYDWLTDGITDSNAINNDFIPKHQQVNAAHVMNTTSLNKASHTIGSMSKDMSIPHGLSASHNKVLSQTMVNDLTINHTKRFGGMRAGHRIYGGSHAPYVRPNLQ
jgi:hypothetical protein